MKFAEGIWKQAKRTAALLLVAVTPLCASAYTEYDVPPDPAPASIGAGDTLNLSDGGTLPDQFQAMLGSTVNISGGVIGSNFRADEQATLNISGGRFGDSLSSGATTTVSGGVFGRHFGAFDSLTFVGSDLEYNGVPIAGLSQIGDTVSLGMQGGENVFSGTLANGDSFAMISVGASFDIFPELTNFQLSAPAAPGPSLISLPGDAAPNSIRSGQTVQVATGGSIPDNFVAGAGSALQMTDGAIGTNFKAVGGEVTVNGGTVGTYFTALVGSTVNFHGATVGDNAYVGTNATVNISGGRIGSNFQTDTGAHVNISGGILEPSVNAKNGVTVVGTDFKINGVPVTGLSQVGDTVQRSLVALGTLTATLSDGTPIVLNRPSDSMGSVTLQLAAPPSPGTPVISLPGGVAPLGVSNGQTINIAAGAAVADSFRAGDGSAVNVTGGSIGADLETFGSHVTLAAGSIGDSYLAYYGTTLDVSGGTIGNGLTFWGTALNLTSGSIGTNANATPGTVINISGGNVGDNFQMNDAIVTISGGSIGNHAIVSHFPIGNPAIPVTISGGSIGDNLTASNSDIHITGGSIGANFVPTFTTVEMSGGSVGDNAHITTGTYSMSGGTLGNNFGDGAIFNLSGGGVGQSLTVTAFGTLNYSGGSIGQGFHLNGTMNISGTSFLLGGVPIPGLVHPGDTVLITVRDGSVLSGSLLDGSNFAFPLNRSGSSTTDVFSPFSTLQVTLVPEPSSMALVATGVFVAAAIGFRRRTGARPMREDF